MKQIKPYFKRVLLSLLALMAMETGAWAETKTVVNVTGKTAKVTQYSTLYVGEVVLDGQPSFYYLYSEDMTNSESVFAVVRDCLHDFKGGIYSALVPDIIGETDDKGIAVCSNAAFQSMMNADWADAYQAGLACLPYNTTVALSSSNNLFLSDAAFAAKCTFEENVDIVDNVGDPLTISGPLGRLSTSITDDITYTVENGVLVKYIDRHIDYTCEMITVIYTKAELSSPLTFEAVETGTITVNLDEGVTFNPIQYNLNNAGWTDVAWNTPIELAANDVVCFRGDNGTCYATDEMNYWAGFHFEPSNPVYVYGNMMSLIDKDGFATSTTLTETYTFFHLFQRSDYEPNTAILNHPTKDIVLPATTLTAYCYDGLFADAPNITRAPELPATTLADWCYSEMFSGTAIATAPALPATTLAESCYADMFMGCTSLTTAPELPAATLVEGCYTDMFAGCTSLNFVKCLATDISADYCTADWLWDVATTGTFVKAAEMNDWTLDSADGIPAGWTVEEYFDPYTTPLTLEAVTDGDITFNYTLSLYHDAELTDIEYQINGGAWTSYTWNDAIPVVTGDMVAFRGNNDSYFGNGKGYESRITSTADVYVYGNVMSLTNSTDYATLTTLTGKDAFSHLFAVAGENPWEVVPNTTIKNHPTKDLVLPATTLTNYCYMNMFSGCQGLTRAPELPATEMTVACYSSMFEGCTGLTVAPALPTTTFTPYGFDETTFEEYGSIDCYMMMFKDCTSLTEAPELPATTLVHGVYQNMFQGCTSLERAPELPAPIVADLAYSYMFEGCTSLNYVKCLAIDFEINPEFGNTAEDNVLNWLGNVAATGTFVKAASMNDWAVGPDADGNVNGIPAGWTVQDAGEYTITIPASGIATFSADEAVTVPDGLTAYYCTTFDADASTIAIKAVEGDVIPATTGVLLRGQAGQTFTLEITTEAAEAITDNSLVAVTTATHVSATDGDYTNFMLSNGCFVKIQDADASVKMPANKAYLQIPTASIVSVARPITLTWDETTTAIADVKRSTSNVQRSTSNVLRQAKRQSRAQRSFDLQGRHVNAQHLQKGLYIVNGKKVYIK